MAACNANVKYPNNNPNPNSITNLNHIANPNSNHSMVHKNLPNK